MKAEGDMSIRLRVLPRSGSHTLSPPLNAPRQTTGFFRAQPRSG